MRSKNKYYDTISMGFNRSNRVELKASSITFKFQLIFHMEREIK